MIITAAATQFLFLTQQASTNIKVLTVEHTVGIADAVAQNLMPQRSRSLLLLTQSLEVRKSVALIANNTLTLSNSTLPRAYNQSVSDFLFVWHEAIREAQWPLVVHELSLDHQVDYDIAKGMYDTLTLTQEVSVSASSGITVTDTLSLVGGVTGFLPSRYWTSFDINVIEEP